MNVDYIGPGSITALSGILKRRHARHLFLVSGKTSFFASGAHDRMKTLLAGKTINHFNRFSQNPKIEDVRQGVSQFQSTPCDMVIAVGGGAAMDMAKLITAAACNGGDPAEFFTRGKKPAFKGPPLVAVPTTAGSGSEATGFAVVYIDRTKYSLAHPTLLPDYRLVDPELTHSLSPRTTAVSAFDALSQAVESYWAIGSNAESKRYAAAAIRLIRSSLHTVIKRPDPASRFRMALGAHLAGKAINLTKTTGPHAASYPLTAYYNIPHGHAVAVFLGRFFGLNSDLEHNRVVDPRGKTYVRETMQQLCGLFACKSAAEFQRQWCALMEAAGLEHGFDALGIKKDSDRNRIVENVNLERLENNPVAITPGMLRDLIGACEQPH